MSRSTPPFIVAAVFAAFVHTTYPTPRTHIGVLKRQYPKETFFFATNLKLLVTAWKYAY